MRTSRGPAGCNRTALGVLRRQPRTILGGCDGPKGIAMAVTAATYERIALEDPEGNWELHRGRLREKPGMSFAHNQTLSMLAAQLLRQLDLTRHTLRVNHGHINRADETYYIPDLFLVPLGLENQAWSVRNVLETYGQPLPLVVEVWSPSAGGYDVDAKFPEYQRRGDQEI